MTAAQRICLGAFCLAFPHQRNRYRPYALRHPVLAFLNALLLVATIGGTLTLSLAPEVARVSSLSAPVLLKLTNAERTRAGLPPLTENSALAESARRKAAHMLRYDYFDHPTPDGKPPWYFFDEAGYDYRYAGENLAIDFTEAEDIVTAWLRSPGHRRNLLSDRYTETGLAVATGEFEGRTTTVVVHHFGSPLAGAPPSVAAAAAPPAPAPAPLAAPVIREPVPGTTIAGNALPVRGTAPAGSSVRLTLDGVTIGLLPAPSGSFEGTVNLPRELSGELVLLAFAVREEEESAPSAPRRVSVDTKGPEIATERALLLPDPHAVPGRALLVLPSTLDTADAVLRFPNGEIGLTRDGVFLLGRVPLGVGPLALRARDPAGNVTETSLRPLGSAVVGSSAEGAVLTPSLPIRPGAHPFAVGALAGLAGLLAVNVLVHARARRLLHADLVAHGLVVLALGTALLSVS